MPTYISLSRWTREGLANVQKSPDRLKNAKAVMKAHGGRLKSFYMTMGAYDMVVISEFPDDDSAAKALLAIGSAGGVVTETMRAFEEAAYRKIVKGIG